MKTPEEELRISERRTTLPTRWLFVIVGALLTLLGIIFELRIAAIEARIDRETERFTERLEFHFGKVPR